MSNEAHHHYDGRRVEDLRLITGAGRFASDWNAPGQLYGHFVRSDRAHAEIVSVDTKKALASHGVKHVFLGEDAVRARTFRCSRPRNISNRLRACKSAGRRSWNRISTIWAQPVGRSRSTRSR